MAFRNLKLVPSEEAWMEHAACKGMNPDLWFPPRGSRSAGREAKAICATCPVTRECLNFALEQGFRDGVWGGRSVSQIRRGRQVA